MNTLTTTRYMLKATAATIKATAKTVKQEADIAKYSNEVADLTIDSKDRAISRDAIKDVEELFTSVGIDKDFKQSRAAILNNLKAEIATLKAV